MNSEPLNVGDQVKVRRLAAGLTQQQLADEIGLHRVSLVNIEGGGLDLPLSTLIALASALGCSATDLLLPVAAAGKRK